MEEVMTHHSLVHCLSKLQVRSPKQLSSLWVKQKQAFRRRAALVKSLGKPDITRAQAKRLDELGFSYQSLLKLLSKSKDVVAFQQALKEKGNSKPLREKLPKLLKK